MFAIFRDTYFLLVAFFGTPSSVHFCVVYCVAKWRLLKEVIDRSNFRLFNSVRHWSQIDFFEQTFNEQMV